MTQPKEPRLPKRSKHLQEITTYFGVEGNRVETGPVQFGNDWPGLFIRGDNAFGIAVQLKGLLHDAETCTCHQHPYPMGIMALRGMINLLESCNVRNLQAQEENDAPSESGSAGVDTDPPPSGDA